METVDQQTHYLSLFYNGSDQYNPKKLAVLGNFWTTSWRFRIKL